MRKIREIMLKFCEKTDAKISQKYNAKSQPKNAEIMQIMASWIWSNVRGRTETQKGNQRIKSNSLHQTFIKVKEEKLLI